MKKIHYGLRALLLAFLLVAAFMPMTGSVYAEAYHPAEVFVNGLQNDDIVNSEENLIINVKFRDKTEDAYVAGVEIVWLLEKETTAGNYDEVDSDSETISDANYGVNFYIPMSTAGSGNFRLTVYSEMFTYPDGAVKYWSTGSSVTFSAYPATPTVKNGVAEICYGMQFLRAMASSDTSIKTVKLMQDVYVDGSFVEFDNTSKTLDLNGHTLDIPYLFFKSGGLTLTVDDSSATADSFGKGMLKAHSGSILFHMGSSNYRPSTLVINNGRFSVDDSPAQMFFIAGNNLDQKIIINGGAFYASNGPSIFDLNSSANKGAEIIIGGDAYFESTGSIIHAANTDCTRMKIGESQFNCDGVFADTVFKDGSLKVFDTENCVVQIGTPDYSIKSVNDINESGAVISVVPIVKEKVTADTSAKLVAALESNKACDITLGKSLTISNKGPIYEKGSKTLNLNGYKLTLDNSLINVVGSLTINTKGTVSASANAVRGTADCLFNVYEGILTINGGNYGYNAGATAMTGLISIVDYNDQEKGGTLVINDGVFKVESQPYGSSYLRCVQLQATEVPYTATINGGQFILAYDSAMSYAIGASGNDHTNLTINGGSFEHTNSSYSTMGFYYSAPGNYRLGEDVYLCAYDASGKVDASKIVPEGTRLNSGDNFFGTGKYVAEKIRDSKLTAVPNNIIGDVGETGSIICDCEMADRTQAVVYHFYSDDPSIASVDAGGDYHLNKFGTTYIHAVIYGDGLYNEEDISIPVTVTDVKLNSATWKYKAGKKNYSGELVFNHAGGSENDPITAIMVVPKATKTAAVSGSFSLDFAKGTVNGASTAGGSFSYTYKKKSTLKEFDFTVVGPGGTDVYYRIFVAEKGYDDLSKATVTGLKTMPYSGSKIVFSDVGLTINGIVLKEDTDYKRIYSADYSNNLNAGTAKLTIQRADNSAFKGSKTATFTISKINQPATAELEGTTALYIGKAPTVISYKDCKENPTISYKLSNRKGYASVAVDNTNKTVTVTGKKAGSVTLTVTLGATTNCNAKKFTYKITVKKPTSIVGGKGVSVSAVWNGGDEVVPVIKIGSFRKDVDYKIVSVDPAFNVGDTFSVAIESTPHGGLIGDCVISNVAVGKAAQTINVAGAVSKLKKNKDIVLTITGQNETPAVTVTSNKYAKVTDNLDGTWTIKGAVVGTATITIKTAATEHYAAATKTLKVKITK